MQAQAQETIADSVEKVGWTAPSVDMGCLVV
jgi:hypothetical protein